MQEHDEHKNRAAESPRVIERAYEPRDRGHFFFIDITFFLSALQSWADAAGARNKQKVIEKLLAAEEWVVLHTDPATGCCVYAEKKEMDHAHEISTARALAAMDYDVLFAPAGMFKKHHRRFDVYLIRGHVMLKADLKSISSKNPATIAKRIMDGAEQANRLVLDIVSDISKHSLIDGLRSGVAGRKTLIEILMFFRNRFYRLTRQEILGKNIYKILQ